MHTLLVISCALALALVVYGWSDLGSDSGIAMPLVGASTAGISAACHVSTGEEGSEVAERGVRWGVLSTKGRIGHLGFTGTWAGGSVSGRLNS